MYNAIVECLVASQYRLTGVAAVAEVCSSK